ncbi:MAG TPA: RNA-binding protein [Hymenobacter sp.]|jgi:RNA recognition motif-containing protein
MANKLFVASLPFAVDDDELAAIFKEAGEVTSAKVVMDRDTNRSKGFGFVEMATDEEAAAAIKMFDGKEVAGRTIVVREARPMEKRDRPQGGGGGGGFSRDNRNQRSW